MIFKSLSSSLSTFYKGANLNIQSLTTKPWITDMSPIPGTDEFEFSGPTPEVWSGLQVTIISN